MTGQGPSRQGRGDPWRGGRPEVHPVGETGPEVEELPAQLVRRRGRGRIPTSTVVLSAALVALLAAGFGFLGGRPSAVPSEPPLASQVAVASASTVPPKPPGPFPPFATPAQPCGPRPGGPPQVFLVVNDAPTAGQVRVTGPGPSIPTDGAGDLPGPIEIAADATVELRIEGDACAIGWYIALAFPEQGLLEPVAVQPNPDLDAALGRQNRFELPLAQSRDEPGALQLEAALSFPDIQILARWQVRLLPFERPKPRLQVARSVASPLTVEGCETVLTFANGVDESLPDCNQDLAAQLPVATKLRPGTRLRLSFGDWVANQLVVICGAGTAQGFLADPPGCRQETEGLEFVAPDAGDWTIAMATCALQDVHIVGNRICGTWYARLDTR